MAKFSGIDQDSFTGLPHFPSFPYTTEMLERLESKEEFPAAEELDMSGLMTAELQSNAVATRQ